MDVLGPGGTLMGRLLEESDKKGFVGAASVDQISRELSIPASRAYSIAGQLRYFHFAAPPQGTINVCAGPACELAGSARIAGALEDSPGAYPTPLLGSPIWHTPVLAVVPGRRGAMPRRVTSDALSLADLAKSPLATTDEPAKELLSGKGELLRGLRRRRSSADYFKSDAGRFARFLAHTTPDEAFRAIRASRLIDTATGHEVADIIEDIRLREAPSRMVVCDTGGREPENDAASVLAWVDPMGVIEGMLLAAHAAGAGRAMLFVPHEHRVLRESFARSIQGFKRQGLWPAVEVEMFTAPNLIPTDREIGIASLYGGLTLSEGAARARDSLARLWGQKSS